MRRRRTMWAAAVSGLSCLLLLATAVSTLADPVTIDQFAGKTMAGLEATQQVKPAITSAYNYNNSFKGTVTSSVWSLSSGNYLYLYQAVNYGPSVLQVLGIAPFYNLKETGYISSDVPTGFLSGGKNPLQFPAGSGNYAVTYDETGGANVSFGYYNINGGSILAGQHSTILYLVSSLAPTDGIIHITDSGVATAQGYTTAVPEPCSLSVLGLGASLIAFARKRKN